jgi:hypothetical protein
MSSAAAIAQALADARKVHRNKRGWFATYCCCHEDRSPSLCIADGDRVPLVVKCHAGCDPGDVLAELRRRGLLYSNGVRSGTAPVRAPEPRRPGKHDGDLWRRIWKQSVAAVGTPVEVYLGRRKLAPPLDAAQVLRFHPHCVFGKNEQGWVHTPAMVALVRNVTTDAPQAMHRTAVNSSGRKVEVNGHDRMALGPVKSGAIKLTADAHVTYALGIAEGIETALSLARLPEWQGLPVWSLINAEGIKSFPVLRGIETLVIAVDHDKAGEDAALAVAERWRSGGREVLLVEATRPGSDLNDVMGTP